jgi:asparagine N-glycosylation enzyme membrane subunit Stt3
MITRSVGIALIVAAIILVVLLAAFDLTNDYPGYLSDPDPRFHETNMRAGEASEQ